MKETYTKGKRQCIFDRFKAAVEPAAVVPATARLRERESREGEKVESVEEKEKRLLASSIAFANVGAFLKSLCGTLSFTYYNILFYFYITVVGCGRCKQSCWS